MSGWKRILVGAVSAALVVLLAYLFWPRADRWDGASPSEVVPQAKVVEVSPEALAIFRSNVLKVSADPTPLVTLGRMLYFDQRLSKNHDRSCNSCHGLQTYGVDNQPRSSGHKGQLGGRNSPTVYNAAGHVAQFWDGRAKDLAEQAKGPIMNPVEMAMPDEARVVSTLQSIPAYVSAFKEAFPGEKNAVTLDNVGKAIAAFERGLETPSRFDQFLAGDQSALTARERHGLSTFISTGCTACHSGPALGGQLFMKLGAAEAWPSDADLGRFAVTHREEDRMVFRVPTLRNIEMTGPYFHDGSVATLDEAIKLMARHQLGKTLTDGELEQIRSFLGSLTGRLPEDYIQAPELPPSTAKTPPPDPS